jgi:hypothetical protein
MTGQDLVEQLRESFLDDNSPPYLWSDTELLRFLNYAEVQACRRAHLLIDGITANDSGTAATASTAGQRPLCVLPIQANVAFYYLSPKILQVKRCQLMSMTYPLRGPISYPETDERWLGWWGTAGTLSTSGTYTTAGSSGTVGASGSGGAPFAFINEPTNTITFVLAPSADDVASLVVSRLPLISFTLRTFPEIAEEYQDGLLDWAAHLAFKKPDSDTINLNLSKMYESSFEARFGPLPNAYNEKMRRTLSLKDRMRPREFGS